MGVPFILLLMVHQTRILIAFVKAHWSLLWKHSVLLLQLMGKFIILVNLFFHVKGHWESIWQVPLMMRHWRRFFLLCQPNKDLLILYNYEVHLKSGLRFIIRHISGTSDYMEEKLATSALVFEMICLHGGPMIVLAVHPVSSLNAEKLIRKSFVENNCVIRTLWR